MLGFSSRSCESSACASGKERTKRSRVSSNKSHSASRSIRSTGPADKSAAAFDDTYDTAGRLLTTTDGAGGVQTWTYDTAGRLATASDPLSHVTTYAYNTAGRLTSMTAPNTGVTSYTYDANGNLLTETDPSVT